MATRRLAHTIALPLPAAEAFPLFDAEGERRWVPGWEPEILYRQPGTWLHAVFRTRADGIETNWLVSAYDVERCFVQYVRMTAASRVALVSVHCRDYAGGCSVDVAYQWTALDDEGERFVAALDEAEFRNFIAGWRDSILAL